jgi:hypothetical protein
VDVSELLGDDDDAVEQEIEASDGAIEQASEEPEKTVDA